MPFSQELSNNPIPAKRYTNNITIWLMELINLITHSLTLWLMGPGGSMPLSQELSNNPIPAKRYTN